MLSRTDFQHISGTRVAMDFVEVPSILNEYFSKSSLVLCSIGQDYQTLNQLSINELQSHLNSLKFNDIFETRDQIMLALQDLLIHSPSICRKYLGKETSSSLEIYKELHSKFGYFDFVDGTAALAQFSHLASYGACYYSYFWSRRLAERIYLDMFSGVSLNGDLDTAIERLAPLGWRRSGELIKTELLQVGGSRDPSIGLLKLNIRND